MALKEPKTRMELQEVIITNRDSCKTYPLRRIGLGNLINWENDTPTIQDIITNNNFQQIDEPEKGCVLIWIKNDYLHTSYLPHQIDKNGFVIWKERYNYGHCGIYEGNDIISDCYTENNKSFLRLRKYSETRKPNFILKWNQTK